jgi:hypothetical protein
MRSPTLKLCFCIAAIVGIGLPALVIAQGPQKDPTNQPGPNDSLSVRYARAFVSLTQLEWQRALDTNKRVPGTYSTESIAALHRSVAFAQALLDQSLAKSEGQKDPKTTIMSFTEARAKAAEADYQRAVEFSNRSQFASDKTELERLRLIAEITKLRVEQSKTLDTNSPAAVLQWEVDQLREDVLLLSQQVARLAIRQ